MKLRSPQVEIMVVCLKQRRLGPWVHTLPLCNPNAMAEFIPNGETGVLSSQSIVFLASQDVPEVMRVTE